MTQLFAFLSSSLIAFFVHHWGEWFFTKKRTRNVRLVIKGFQVHHSIWGVLAILLGLVLANGTLLFVLLGYGFGNLWQHKYMHNSVNEKGMVFITRTQ